MQRIILRNEDEETVVLDRVPESKPIFMKKEGKFVGMLVKEEEGWIIRVGSTSGYSGHHSSRLNCMKDTEDNGYTFHIEG